MAKLHESAEDFRNIYNFSDRCDETVAVGQEQLCAYTRSNDVCITVSGWRADIKYNTSLMEIASCDLCCI